MTTVIIDSFNRTAADLAASPVGRWSVQLLSGTTAAFSIDGQSARTADSWTHSTRGAALWIGTDPGVNHGRWRARLRRNTTDVKIVALIFRSNNDDPTIHDRYFFGYDSAASGYALRRYAGSTSIAITHGTSAVTLDTDWHLYEASMTSVGGGNVAIVCKVDGVTIFSVVTPDFQTTVSATERRGMGIEFSSTTTSADWDPTPTIAEYPPPMFPTLPEADIAYCDSIEFDDLVTGSAEFTPMLTAEPTLTPVSVSTEVDDLDVTGFPVAPDWQEEQTSTYLVDEAPTDADYVATWSRTTTVRRSWRLTWSVLNATDYGALQAFLETNLHRAFPYTAYDGSIINVTVLDGSFVYDLISVGVYGNVSMIIEEAITP